MNKELLLYENKRIAELEDKIADLREVINDFHLDQNYIDILKKENAELKATIDEAISISKHFSKYTAPKFAPPYTRGNADGVVDISNKILEALGEDDEN